MFAYIYVCEYECINVLLALKLIDGDHDGSLQSASKVSHSTLSVAVNIFLNVTCLINLFTTTEVVKSEVLQI